MEKKRNLKLMAISTFALLLVSAGITWAFFSYVFTGDANVFETGDIYFNSNYSSVTLTNVFPISKGKVETDTENVMTVTVDITGHTTYEQGVDFKIMAKDVSLQTNGKKVPISVIVTSENIPNVETFSFEDEMVVVENSIFAQGNIMPEDGNVNGVVTIKAFIDKANVVITDTYDGSESDEMGTTNEFVNGRDVFTTDEWNNLESNGGVSFKVKVIAWEHEETLHDVMLANAVMDNIASDYVTSPTGINFGLNSSDENGKGLYMRAGTENDAYPIVYYRGDVKDNNVIFGNYCWKAVRTTETGGVKLIYNGVPGDVYEYGEQTTLTKDQYTIVTNPTGFVFDSSDNTWTATITEGNSHEISFKIPAGKNYQFVLTGNTSSTSSGGFAIYRNESSLNGGGGGSNYEFNWNYEYGVVSPSDVIKFTSTITGHTSDTPTILKIKMIGSVANSAGTGCDNIGNLTQLETTSVFNSNNNSLAYNGYMYNTVYNGKTVSSLSSIYFGTDFTYENGVYTLTSPSIGYDSTSHYSCNSTSSTGTCTTLRYYYYILDYRYYIELANGKSVEDAINEMLYNSDVNKTDSTVKTNLELWYKNNLVGLSDKIEDTVWCNDRSVPTEGDYAFSNSGWNPNGGDISTRMYYNAYDRVYNTKSPVLICSNVTDKFSISNRFATTNYPVGLITNDEIMLAGGSTLNNDEYYLYTGVDYWTMSPYNDSTYTSNIYLSSQGSLSGHNVSLSRGLRPLISLAYGATIEEGDGTAASPYVISSY